VKEGNEKGVGRREKGRSGEMNENGDGDREGQQRGTNL
jgi:hypothetical protein